MGNADVLSRLRFLLSLLLALAALLLIIAPDIRDGLRKGDALLIDGRYYAAFAAYQRLAPDPLRDIRLGMVRTIRGEYEQAERDLRRALQQSLHPSERNTALLYLGYVLAMRGQDYAPQWALILPCNNTPLQCETVGAAYLLRATQERMRGDAVAAQASYQTALNLLPAGPWYDLALRWIMTLALEQDPALARLLLGTPSPRSTQINPLLLPLLPSDAPSRDAIIATLNAPAADEAWTIAEFLLSNGRFASAAVWFARVPSDSPHALVAAAGGAYARWRVGRTPEALRELEQLVQQHPNEARLRTMLALAYLTDARTNEAQAQIAHLANDPASATDASLAQASLDAAQRDYVAASLSYQRALAQSSPERRGAVALLVAQFHLATAYDLCGVGIAAAEVAAANYPQSAEAWATLAVARQRCDTPAHAIEAAQRAMALAPRADVAYHLGIALVAQGEYKAAQEALIQAADLAPNSFWRVRAEDALARLP